ncbi:GNAT family N-acetyltransferase [Chengkuizengella sp. SCS-71B]|uniref:GNAT family N-acetyltransferase n=1 Tax=Chengkuizengella sp. SCS-71B TaxID=3115290 RepID=UPI0032C210A2
MAKKPEFLTRSCYSMGNLYQNVLFKQEKVNEMELALTQFNSKRALSRVNSNLILKNLGDCTLIIDSNAPNSIYYNRIKGFGNHDIDKVDDILDTYYSERITPCFDMTPNNINFEVSQVLMNKGFFCSEQLVFLELEPYFTEYDHREIEIVRVTKNNAKEFINLILLSDGKEVEKDLIEKKSVFFYQSNFQNFIAYIDGEAVGMGSLFIKGEEGYIANGFTFPPYRGRKVQKSLLHFRIQVAKELGLTKLYTDVEFGSISHNNLLKVGFQSILTSSFWMKAK